VDQLVTYLPDEAVKTEKELPELPIGLLLSVSSLPPQTILQLSRLKRNIRSESYSTHPIKFRNNSPAKLLINTIKEVLRYNIKGILWKYRIMILDG
jgi:hypothetical protein